MQSANKKRAAWRLVPFIFDVQRELGKQPTEVGWLGSPVLSVELLVAMQIALQARRVPDWENPIQRPVVDLVGRAWALGKKAKKVDTFFATDAKRATKSLKNSSSWNEVLETRLLALKLTRVATYLAGKTET